MAEGIEVVIDPQRAGLSPEAVRQFIQGVMTAFKTAQGEEDGASQVDPANTNKNERQAGEPMMQQQSARLETRAGEA